MNRPLRRVALVVAFTTLVACATSDAQGQDTKDKKKAVKWSPAVEPTEKTGKEWFVRETKLGLKLMSDKDYYIAALPKELVGSSFIMRTSADHAHWLPPASVKAKKDGTAYAMIRVEYNGKAVFSEVDAAKLEKDGWTVVEGKAATSFPGKENWQWVVFKTDIKEGEVNLQLSALRWPGTAVFFFFK